MSVKGLSAVAAAIALLCGSVASAADLPVSFNRDIRPILASNCLKCHGIDASARKANLRLDLRETATSPAKSGKPAIVPGKPRESEVIRHVFSTDPDEVMPPPSTHFKLSDEQKNLLRTWIAQGAPYEAHWAFVAPKQNPLPQVRQADWPKNPIDRWVLANLELHGLHPSPASDRYTLVRRVYLDLIGLPPTPGEADEFVKDPSPDAYEKLVDKLLASPHYGERWARRWLDLARYADTNGFEKDRPRSIWPYRDWVIRALNSDMPFDEFTVEQLAGDMLPNATVDQKIATGFNRNTMLNEEGGIDPLEYRYLAEVDRTNTAGTVWLGLTVGCAQCHTHKYDPITQKEYYRLMAFLDNADEPMLNIPDAKIDARRQEIERKIAALNEALPEHWPLADPVKWQTPVAKVTTANGSIAEQADDGAWRFTGPSPDRDTYTMEFDSTAEAVDGIRLQTLKDTEGGPGRTHHGNYVLSEISVTVAPSDDPEHSQTVKLVRAEADLSQNGFSVDRAIDGRLDTGWAVDPGDGTRITGHTATFFFDKPISFPAGAHWTVKLDQQYGEHHTIAKLRLSLGTKSAPQQTPASPQEGFERAFAEWLKSESAKAIDWKVLRPDAMESSKPFLTVEPDGSVLAGGDVVKSCTYDLTFHPALDQITAIRLEVLPDPSLPNGGPGMVFYEGQLGDFFLSELDLQADGKPVRFERAVQDGGSAASAALDGDPQTGWSLGDSAGQAHVAVFSLPKPLKAPRELKLRMLFERYYAAPLGHFRISATRDPRAAHPQAMPADVEAALAQSPNERSAAQQQRLRAYFLEVAPELADARKQIEELRRGLPRYATTLVMRERPPGHPRPTFVHHRGEFLQTQEQVGPGVPAFLPPLPADAQPNRLSFARWLVSAQNPLTARVQVNRQWAAFFGRGIVRTLQDFGYQGEPPSNQELLDWLAVEFIKQGWSLKKLDKLIVTSATYQQSSAASDELLARDPDNALLARGPRFRLEAELIRDSALKVSGLLSEKIGGPSVFPPQPPSVTTEGAYGALAWNASTGEARFRRSLYTFSKRTAPFALYNTFDAPSGEACLARREMSNSPLQALALLNDTVFVEAAQQMGRTFAKLNESDELRCREIVRRCLTRGPEAQELSMLVEFAQKQRERFASKELDAAKVAGPGEADPAERATWTSVARTVLNLHEMVSKE